SAATTHKAQRSQCRWRRSQNVTARCLMTIDSMPDVLTWRTRSAVLDIVYRSFVEALSDQLGDVLRCLLRANAGFAEPLISEFQRASNLALMRVLMAPETSYRLIARGEHDLIATGRFLMNAFKAEVAREGGDIPFEEETWTAVGDICFQKGKMVKRFPII